MGRYVDLSQTVTASYYDEEREEWRSRRRTIEDLLDDLCDSYTTIDAAPIRRGEWADVHFRTVPYDRITGAKKCPYCGKKKDKYVQWNWCPNCGAKLMNNKVSTTIGEWVDDGDPLTLVCGVCGYRVMRYNNTKFCPDCGTRLEGGR